MVSKKLLLTAFIIIAALQLYIPAKMILDRESVLETGTEFKFKTEPIDPNDPFRGKYISLFYEENMTTITNEKDWSTGENVYVSINTDNDGFAQIKSISKEPPIDQQNFVEAKVSYVTRDGSNSLTIDYPFERFYMEESKAYDAEISYRRAQLDSTKVTYALVTILNGEAVLKDVLIDGVSIKDLVTANQVLNK